MNHITIICGRSGAGKGTLCSYLCEKVDGLIWKPSLLTGKVLDEFDIPNTRENLSNMMQVLRSEFTEDIYIHAARAYIEKHPNTPLFFDGIRKIHFIKKLQEIEKCTIIYVDAALQIRYERLSNRWEKLTESSMTFEQFLSDESLESEAENEMIRNMADRVIENTSTKEDLYESIEWALFSWDK